MQTKLMKTRKRTTKRSIMVRNLTALFVMMAVCVGSVITVMAKTVQVTIVDNGETTSLSMMDPTKESVLDTAVQHQQIAKVTRDDEVIYDEETNSLTIRRGIEVMVTADGESRKVKLYYGDTAMQAVAKSGFTMADDDVLSQDADTVLTQDTQLSITRYYHVNVTADGNTQTVLVEEGDVSSALAAASVTLGEEDFTDVALEESLSEGMEVKVSRVTYEEESKTEVVDYTVKQVETEDLYKGETKVQTQGVEGERTITYRNKLIDGEVVETTEISNEITKEPVQQVELIGTKARPVGYATISADGTLIDHNGNTVSYTKALTGRCGKWGSDRKKQDFRGCDPTPPAREERARPPWYDLQLYEESYIIKVIPRGTGGSGREVQHGRLFVDSGGGREVGRVGASDQPVLRPGAYPRRGAVRRLLGHPRGRGEARRPPQAE